MKKLMIAAAAAAMIGGAYADTCSEAATQCRAWDVKMTLKSLGPKKIKCTIAADSACDDPTTSIVYYMDNVTRKATGYLWICDYTCGDAANAVIWDSKNQVALMAYAEEAVAMDNLWVYGKKATKVAGTLEFVGQNILGEDALEVVASGINGKMVRGSADDDCYVKSLSGYVAGTIAYIKPGQRVIATSGTLCGEPEVEVCDEYVAKLIPFCDACCFEGWCDADDAEDMIPACGTWSLKYNKKVSKGNKSIAQLAPAYAL